MSSQQVVNNVKRVTTKIRRGVKCLKTTPTILINYVTLLLYIPIIYLMEYKVDLVYKKEGVKTNYYVKEN